MHFCKVYFANLKKIALLLKNICIDQKKAVPLQRQLKIRTKVYLTYSRLDLIHKSKSSAKLQNKFNINK